MCRMVELEKYKAENKSTVSLRQSTGLKLFFSKKLQNQASFWHRPRTDSGPRCVLVPGAVELALHVIVVVSGLPDGGHDRDGPAPVSLVRLRRIGPAFVGIETSVGFAFP